VSFKPHQAPIGEGEGGPKQMGRTIKGWGKKRKSKKLFFFVFSQKKKKRKEGDGVNGIPKSPLLRTGRRERYDTVVKRKRLGSVYRGAGKFRSGKLCLKPFTGGGVS